MARYLALWDSSDRPVDLPGTTSSCRSHSADGGEEEGRGGEDSMLRAGHSCWDGFREWIGDYTT